MVTITRFLSKAVVPLLAALLVGGCYTQLATVQSEGEEEAYEPTVTDSTAVEPEDDYGTSSTQVYFPSGNSLFSMTPLKSASYSPGGRETPSRNAYRCPCSSSQ